MREGSRRSEDSDPTDPSTSQLVVAAATLMITAQIGFRAWTLYPSWFYFDDFKLLSQARGADFAWSYLASPYDNQFMPFGRAIVWLVGSSGNANWGLAATVGLGLHLLANTACLWMLVRAFGARWRILVPLGLYLWLAVPLPGQLWWAASLNQTPLHIAFFGAVAAWIAYARTRTLGWLAVVLLFLAFGLMAYVKTALVFPVLAYLLLAYFSSGGPVARVTYAVRRYWPALGSAVVMGVAFAWYYTAHVPPLFQGTSLAVASRLAESMVGTALATGLVGGPWRWDDLNPPAVGADPPAWAVNLSWSLIAVLVVVLALRRTRTLRAWALLAGYTATTYALLVTTRAPVVGEIAGLQYRYVTDVVPVAALCLGLATMELRGAVESSEVREPPLLTAVPRTAVVVVLTALVFGSGTVSSIRYANAWHHDNPASDYSHTVMSSLNGRGPVDFADQVVPEEVMSGLAYPYNTTKRMLPLLADNALFPESSSRLAILDDNGIPYRVEIDAATTSLPGPTAGCGWSVRSSPLTIPMQPAAFDFDWWVRIAYLGSGDDTMTITIGNDERQVAVQRGAHSLFVHVTGEIPSVTLGGLEDSTHVCVDTIEVGTPMPGSLL